MMSYVLTELYTAKPAWNHLGENDRRTFISAVGAAMPGLSALGVETLALGKVDHGKVHSAPQAFFAIWRCPDEAALDALVSGIAASGWHDYFETLNAGGAATDFAGHVSQLNEVQTP